MQSLFIPRVLRVLFFFPVCVAAGVAHSTCKPTPNFKDVPHPAVAPAAQLVSHTEEIVIPQPYAVVEEAMNKPLQKVIRKSDALPGVAGDYMLTKGVFGAPGSRHIVCLTDGGDVEEEALERDGTDHSGHFRYIVWNYTTPKARPIAYGVGEFKTVQTDEAHTRISWTYSFKLKDDVFPGDFGALGRWIFRVGFLDRDYAAMMRGVLERYKTDAAAAGAGGKSTAADR